MTGALYADAGIEAFVVDTGFPPAASAPPALMSAGGVRQVRLLRLELLFQELVAAHPTYDDVLGALGEALRRRPRRRASPGSRASSATAPGSTCAAGADADARAAFAAARAEAGGGPVRLGHQPLLDTLLHVALTSRQRRSCRCSSTSATATRTSTCGRASPLALRAVVEEHRGAQVVLLHGCWPYVREGAFLAAVYGNVHLDLSYASRSCRSGR